MALLNTAYPDDCCGKPFRAAALAGTLDTAEAWTCPKCGCEWKPQLVGVVRYWEPVNLVAIW